MQTSFNCPTDGASQTPRRQAVFGVVLELNNKVGGPRRSMDYIQIDSNNLFVTKSAKHLKQPRVARDSYGI